MSTRASVILTDDCTFHLFQETNEDDKLTLEMSGLENDHSGGLYVNGPELIQFAKDVLALEDKIKDMK